MKCGVVFVFLIVSNVVHANDDGQRLLHGLGSYGGGIVNKVATPLTDDNIKELSEDFKNVATWKTYLYPLLRASIAIVAVTLILYIGFIVSTCICCCVSIKGSKPCRMILNGVILALIAITMLFGAFSLYAAAVTSTKLIDSSKTAIDYIKQIEDLADKNCQGLSEESQNAVNMIKKWGMDKALKRISNLPKSVRKYLSHNLKDFNDKTAKIVTLINGTNVECINDLLNIINTHPEAKSINRLKQLEQSFEYGKKLKYLNVENEVKLKFDAIEAKITKNVRVKLIEVLNKLEAKVSNGMRPVDNFCKQKYSDQGVDMVNQAKAAIGEKNLKIPYYIGLTVAIALIIGLAIAAIAVVLNIVFSTGISRCNLLNTGTFLIASYLPLIAILAAFLLLIGGTGTLLCEPLQKPLEHPDIIQFFDNLLLKQLPDTVAFNNKTYKITELLSETPITKFLKDCRREKSVVNVFGLVEKLQINETLNANSKRAQDRYTKQLNEYNIGSVTGLYRKEIEKMRDQINAGGDFDTQDYTDWQLFADSPEIEKAIKGVEQVIENMNQIKKLLPTDKELNRFTIVTKPSNIKKVINRQLELFNKDRNVMINQLLRSLKRGIDQKILNCGDLRQLVDNLRTEVCVNTVDPLNAWWVSLLHVIVFAFPLVYIGLYLSKLYKGEEGSSTEENSPQYESNNNDK
ncbi:unnamed protein product [Bursaphelenchus okinawaensis]|uniref:Prominin-like protein n=1 Tax=Bursaphelenchus okinawaensis TaxID=465554 RepID=A0A811KBV8_9BILA|nr:unnamed protein product [Bursaphelenchus okinawaensis]CAG9097837.1 unnamed protein product [Bursaphelenchus okinawaensis]